MAKPTEPIREKVLLNMGERQTRKVVSMEGDLVTLKVTGGEFGGCTFTYDGWFGPSTSYESCGRFGSGKQEFTKHGEIWPLTSGTSESYKVTGSNGRGDTWKTTRNCEVKSAVLVSIQDRTHPAYEVMCKDKFNSRTWYVSPELQTTIKFKRVHKRRGVESDWVMVVD